MNRTQSNGSGIRSGVELFCLRARNVVFSFCIACGILFGLVACKFDRSVDSITVVRELPQVLKKFESYQFEQTNHRAVGSPESIWSLIPVFEDVSFDTMYFLSQHREDLDLDVQFISPRTRSRISELRNLGVMLNRGTLVLKNPGPSDLKAWADPNAAERIQQELGSRFEALKKEHKIYGWQLTDPKVRDAFYCEDECACVGGVLGEELLAREPDLRVFYMYVNGGDTFGLSVRGSRGNTLAFDYHVALLVHGSSGFGVVDQIVYRDTAIHDLSEWYSRFAHKTDFYVRVSQVRPTLKH